MWNGKFHLKRIKKLALYMVHVSLSLHLNLSLQEEQDAMNLKFLRIIVTEVVQWEFLQILPILILLAWVLMHLKMERQLLLGSKTEEYTLYITRSMNWSEILRVIKETLVLRGPKSSWKSEKCNFKTNIIIFMLHQEQWHKNSQAAGGSIKIKKKERSDCI